LILLIFSGLGPHLPFRCGNRRSGFGHLRHVFFSEPTPIGGLGVEHGYLVPLPAEYRVERLKAGARFASYGSASQPAIIIGKDSGKPDAVLARN
jgi:hypothetical protein